mgnify:CR=1 FL=1
MRIEKAKNSGGIKKKKKLGLHIIEIGYYYTKSCHYVQHREHLMLIFELNEWKGHNFTFKSVYKYVHRKK